jgi:hypothetical protein
MQTQLDGADLTCEEMEVFQNDAMLGSWIWSDLSFSGALSAQTNKQTNERPLLSHAGARRAR